MPHLPCIAGVILFAGALAGCQPPPGQPGGPPLRPAVPQQRPGTPQPPQAQRPAIRPNAVTVTRSSGTTQADFEIHLDREAMAANKVDQATVTQSLQQFFTTYPFFSLIDLQDLKIKSTDGREVQLKQIATVDVWFGPAKTEIVVGQGK